MVEDKEIALRLIDVIDKRLGYMLFLLGAIAAELGLQLALG